MSESEENAKSTDTLAKETLQDKPLLQSIIEDAAPNDAESRELFTDGLQAFLRAILGDQNKPERVNAAVVDAYIDDLDRQISEQVDEVMHNEDFQRLESAWRGLDFLVDRTDFRENVKVEVLSATKQEILDDFEDSPEVVQSGLYRHVYTEGVGRLGGEPVGAIVANYHFGPGGQDMEFLQSAAKVAAMAHAPIIAAADADFFGGDFEKISSIKDMKTHFSGNQFTKWRSFRDTPEARYVGLTAPGFLLRAPYGADKPAKTFNYVETADSHDDFLWGNSAFAMASKLTDSFAKYRWCSNIAGPRAGGSVPNLPIYNYEELGNIKTREPIEVALPFRPEFELSEEGFISLVYRKDSDEAVFLSASSTQVPKKFGGTEAGKAQETNYRLGTQLPYLFMVSRLAHYLKVLQVEHIASWRERTDLERELNNWMGQYVSAQDNPPAEVRSRKPFKGARVEVSEIPGEVGFYKVDLAVTPHIKYMGANFELSLVGRLDREADGA